ncbi:hypothetical protein E2C01_016495 [Portunus trituberculatus]|uniref:Uncharacterized protein n=1 Tax=Portunus trituberculatus TaxID=210409 RepID=A0A5B7DR93_PORTR|nr:hypothetical protein [Portunus trituberculatus]
MEIRVCNFTSVVCWSPSQSSPLRSELRAHRPIFEYDRDHITHNTHREKINRRVTTTTAATTTTNTTTPAGHQEHGRLTSQTIKASTKHLDTPSFTTSPRGNT